MRGICGWIPAGAAPEGSGDPGSVERAMRPALAHRGGVGWLGPPEPGGGGEARIVADSSFNDGAALAAAWSSARGDGEGFAGRLEGSFACAVHDVAGRRLLLVRDRLGEKPLSYTLLPDGVLFSSEMKALRAAGHGGPIRPEALDAYLAFTYVPAPWTMHSDLMKVPAGHLVEIDLAGSAPRSRTLRYWQAPPREGLGASPAVALERLDGALRRRLPGTGRLAAFLSGGLDSSIVVALMTRAESRPILTFSAGFDESDLDESRHALRVAAFLGTEHRRILVSEVSPDVASRVIAQLDEPMADAASIPMWILAGAACAEASVVMTGDGADALLAGDHWFRRVRRISRMARLPSGARRALAAGAEAFGSRAARRVRDLAGMAELPAAERYLRIREKWTPSERMGIYAEAFRGRVDISRTASTYLEAPVGWGEGDPLDAVLRLDATHGLPEDLLMKVDKMGMAHGVECRSPFLDRQWVEWAGRLDTGLLLRGGSSKDLLKRAARELLPRDLIYRRKQGFRVPMGRWLRGPLRDLTEAAFSPALLRRQEIFSTEAMAELKVRFEREDLQPALSGKVWQIVAFQSWWRQVFG